MLDQKYNQLLLKLINSYSSLALTICYLSDEIDALKADNSPMIKEVKAILNESKYLHNKIEKVIKHYNK